MIPSISRVHVGDPRMDGSDHGVEGTRLGPNDNDIRW